MPSLGNEVPSGGIIIWSGAIANIPQGWWICDGTNGTPDLTDRFVIHADADAAGTNDVGDSGGAKTHTLTGAESGTSIHTHPMPGKSGGSLSNAAVFAHPDTETNDNPQNTGASSAANAASAHTNRDLYYALAYIMKT